MMCRIALYACVVLVLCVTGSMVWADPPLRDSGLQSLTTADQPVPEPDTKKIQPGPANESMVIERFLWTADENKFQVDAAKHCVYVLHKHEKLKDGAVRIDLQRGTHYTISAEGEAFQSTHEGSAADPFPGVVVFYGTNEEDGYATRYAVLKPNESLSFTTPWLIGANDEVYMLAFFLDHWPESDNRGSFQLTVTQQGKVRTFDAEERLQRGLNSGEESIDDIGGSVGN